MVVLTVVEFEETHTRVERVNGGVFEREFLSQYEVTFAVEAQALSDGSIEITAEVPMVLEPREFDWEWLNPEQQGRVWDALDEAARAEVDKARRSLLGAEGVKEAA